MSKRGCDWKGWGVAAPVAAQPRFALFMYLLGLVSVVLVHHGGRHVSAFELVVDVYLLCLVLWLLPRRVASWARAAVCVVAYGLALVDLFCFYRFGEPISASFVRLCLETNQREATEALRAYVTPSQLPWAVWLVVGLMVGQAWTALRAPHLPPPRGRVYYPCQKEKHIVPPPRGRQVGGSIFFALFLLISIAVSARNMWFIYRNLVGPSTTLEMEYATELPHDGGLYLPFYRFLYACKAVGMEQQSIEKLERQADVQAVDSCRYASRDIVFIIGEAYNRGHSQLYGYRLPTAPRQAERARAGELVAFADVVTPYHQTSQVFRLVFSLYGYGQTGDWTDYPLFPQLFRQAGYRVAFVTNQFVPAPSQSIFDFSGSVFLNTPVLSRSMFNCRNTRRHDFDLGLLDDLDSLDVYRGDYNLTIVHLLGQHTSYFDRCPASEACFTEADYQRPDLSADELREVAAYDNACRYNDRVVDGIIGRYASREAVVVYMPDHGEMVYDGCHRFGRTLAVTTKNEVRQQFEIPFWIWASERYRLSHPETWEAVRRASELPFMTDNADQLLLGLAGIASPYYREADDPLSNRYDASRKRMLMGTIDYDATMRQQGEGTIGR